MNNKYQIGGSLYKKLLDILKDHPEGLTIKDLARISGAHRQTVAKYLLVLHAQGEIETRNVGPAVLHYLKGLSPKNGESGGAVHA